MTMTRKRVMAFAVMAGFLLSSLPMQASHPVNAAGKAKVLSVKVTNVKKKKVTLKVGKSQKLKVKVKVKPNKGKYKKVSFKSSNKKIVKVNKKGKLTAVKAGNAKVTVTSRQNKKKKTVIRVTVKKAAATPNPTSKVSVSPVPSNGNSSQNSNGGNSNIGGTPTATVTAAVTSSPTPTATPEPDGTSTLMRKPFAEQANVGDTLADLPIRSGSIQDSNGAEIAGTYEWEKPDTVLTVGGKSHHDVKFIPEDASFETVHHISLPVHTTKNQLTIVTRPKAGTVRTGYKLSQISLTGGKVTDAEGNVITGTFSWAKPEELVTAPGSTKFMAVFTPTDTVTYRTEVLYVTVNVTGTALTDSTEAKNVDLTGGTWKNEEAYSGIWSGTIYNLTPYLTDIDLSKYTKLTVTANVYDSSNQRITDTNSNYIGFKLANEDGDWAGFSDAYVNSTATLSLGGYAGGDLYLVAQNSSASVGYIEITSITLETGAVTNVKDGSSLKAAFGDIFGKVGNALVGNQMRDSDCLNFISNHYNSVTMGNEMKPDYLLNSWAPTLQDSNPDGYVNTADFTYPYKDTKYPKINMDSIDSYLETAYDNGLKMRYHVFVWHKQTPQWFFKENFDKNADYVSPEVMNGRLEYLVRNVMTHIYTYKNKEGVYIGREVVDNWDMANEYLHNNDGDSKSYWDEVYYPEYSFSGKKHSGILTPVYIKQAFAIGHSILEEYDLADRVSLMYNEYNTYMVGDQIVKMIQYFNTKDDVNPDGEVICDGVGMQTHLDMGYPTIESIGTNAIDKFKAAGFEIQLTEMDLTDKAQTEKTQENQAKKWYNLMMLLMTQKESGAKITGIVWWGPSDNHSWRSEGVPLLFSEYWKAKEHYFEAVSAASWYNQGDTEWQLLS